MKRNNKKGFTIVELVIVIAVIAILAGVMIPTFGSIIENAKESNRDQAAKNALTNLTSNYDFVNKTMADFDGVIVIDGYYYEVVDGNIQNIGAKQSTTVIAGTVLYNNAPAVEDGE